MADRGIFIQGSPTSRTVKEERNCLSCGGTGIREFITEYGIERRYCADCNGTGKWTYITYV